MGSNYINFTPPNIADGFGLYHWSPCKNRKAILHYGIRVGMWSPDRLWKPPCSCWADNPQLGWELSGRVHPEFAEWDLWMTYSNIPKGAELRIDYSPHRRGHYVKEYRIYERVYKRNLWYVGSRSQNALLKTNEEVQVRVPSSGVGTELQLSVRGLGGNNEPSV